MDISSTAGAKPITTSDSPTTPSPTPSEKPVPVSGEMRTLGGVEQEAARVASISTVRPGEKTLADIIKGRPESPLHESESKVRVKAIKLAGVLAPVDRESKDAIRKAALDGDRSVRIAAWDEIDNFKD